MNRIQPLIRQYVTSQDQSILLSVIEELQQGDSLWTAYSPVTKNHYIEYHGDVPTAFVFSELSFCQAFQAYLASRKIKISPMESDRSARLSMFSDFYRNGIEQVMVDNGQTFVTIALTEILNRPDFSALPEQQRPVMNPTLLRCANLFFQSQETDESNPQISTAFLRALYHAKFLLPLILDGQPPQGMAIRPMTLGGASLTLAVIPRAEGGCYIPVFTDWTEFTKIDRNKTCVGNVVTFGTIAALCAQGECISVNPLGFNMLVDKAAADGIVRRFGQPPAGTGVPSKDTVADVSSTAVNVPSPAAVETPVPSVSVPSEPTQPEEEAAVPAQEDETSAAPVQADQPAQGFAFYDLTRVPDPMIRKLYEVLTRTEGVQAAYLRGLRQNDRPSYVCIVDFDDTTDPSVFPQLAQEVGPLTEGLAFNFVNYHSDLGREAAGDSYPFFTR